MKERSNNQYSANWLDRHHLGFVNLVVYALLPHSRAERDELELSRHLQASEMNALWPRPWLYLRTLVLLVVELGLLYWCWKQEGRYESSNLLPGLTVVGSLAMPITLLIFFWEVNKWRSLTLLDVLRYFLIGSCLAITITFVLQDMLDQVPDRRWYYNGHNYITPRLIMNHEPIPTAITAFVEELAKAVVIVAMLWHSRRRCHILHGILIGATVGAGFAVFESAGYINMDLDKLLNSIIMRSLTAPACHVAWGALLGGAVAMAARGRLRWSSLTHPLTVGAFVLVCGLHFGWNYLLYTQPTVNRNTELMVLTWFLLLLLMWQGVREIAREQGR